MKTKTHFKKLIALFMLGTAFLNANAQWSLSGNASTNPPTDFLGTTDSKAFVIKTNGTERARFLSTGEFIVGGTSLINGEIVAVQKSQNAATHLRVYNGTSGTAAAAAVHVTNSSSLSVGISSYSAGWTTSGITVASAGACVSNNSAGFNIGTTSNTQLSFWTNDTKRMTVANGGKVGIGTASPTYQFQISTDSAAKLTTNTWFTTSDQRLKKDIKPFSDGLGVILRINPVYYHYNGLMNTPTEKENIGIIAQEIQKVAPYTIGTFKAKLQDNDEKETELLSFNSHALTFVLINAVKELNEELTELKAQVSALSGQGGTLGNIQYGNSVAKLFQNNPNPFTESTTINYELSADVKTADVYIYDMQGKQIKRYTISNGGKGSVKINGSELSPGMYMYSLVAGGKVIDTKGMMLTE